MVRHLKARLSIMMFLQFFIWGAWYATGGNYMKAHGMANVIYLAYMTSATGAIISPFFLGMIADRFFPVQKLLGVMHILSGIFVFSAPFFAEGAFASTPLFLGCLLLHMLCYMPTVNLSAATAFHLLDNREKQFPMVRLFGTLGWITAGIIVSKILHSDDTAIPMRIAGIGGVLMGFTVLPCHRFRLPARAKKYRSGTHWCGCLCKIKIPFLHHFYHRTAAHQSSFCSLFFLCAGFSAIRRDR